MDLEAQLEFGLVCDGPKFLTHGSKGEVQVVEDVHRHHKDCDEHLDEDGCDRCCLDFRIASNPFPATLHAGSCLNLLVEYVATCRCESCCELLIECDDPEHPTKKIRVTGHLRYTVGSRLKCWIAHELDDILRERGH